MNAKFNSEIIRHFYFKKYVKKSMQKKTKSDVTMQRHKYMYLILCISQIETTKKLHKKFKHISYCI